MLFLKVVMVVSKSQYIWVKNAMFLQPWKDATVSQVIPVLPPGDYRLSFNYVARPNHPGNTQIWLGTKKLGEVESDATMRHFSTDFSLSEKQENVLFKFFSPARDAEKDIAIENVVLQRLDASIGDAKYPDLLTAMIHAADGNTIVYAPADGDAELKDGVALAGHVTGENWRARQAVYLLRFRLLGRDAGRPLRGRRKLPVGVHGLRGAAPKRDMKAGCEFMLMGVDW